MGLETKHYVKEGRKTLTVLIGMVGIMFLLEKVTSLLTIRGVFSVDDSVIIGALILLGYLVIGVYMLTGGVGLAFRLYKISMGGQYGHLTVSEEDISYKSPLGHKEVVLNYNDIKQAEFTRLDDLSVRLDIIKKFTVLSGVKDGEKIKIFLTNESYKDIVKAFNQNAVVLKGFYPDIEVVHSATVEEALAK